MKHPSLYLNWYIHVPTVKHDFRSSGITYPKCDLMLREADLNSSYAHRTAELLAQRYHVRPENVFTSSEGASGQNARIIRYLAERNTKKNEAIVEYPTYEPLLRQVQEFFPRVQRLERKEKGSYGLDADELRKTVSERTGLLVLTNPHAPSGAISGVSELKEVSAVAREYGFYIICDEIYAEFNRDFVPTIYSVDEDFGIVTTSFTKAYGLGGLRLGIALAGQKLVDELNADVVNTIGGGSNIVLLVAVELLTKGKESLERHKQKWVSLKKATEEWLNEKSFEFFPSKAGVTYWTKLPTKDSYKWINEHTIPKYSLAAVPGAFFLFKSDYRLIESNMVRLGLGNIDPDDHGLTEAFEVLEKSLETWKS